MYKSILWIIFSITLCSLLSCRPSREPYKKPPEQVDRETGDRTPAPATPFCSRNEAVQEAIMEQLSVSNCSSIDISDLFGITILDLPDTDITHLQPNDLAGLIDLKRLYLYNNNLTSLPADIFYGLNALEIVDLDYNPITDLAVHTFTSLPALKTLRLRGNSLPRELKEQLREQLSHLDELKLTSY